MIRNFLICYCVFAAIMYKGSSAATGGSYAAGGSFAAINSKNSEVESKFTVPSLPSDRTSINSVSWVYSPSRWQQGFNAILCWNGKSSCVDMTGLGSGSDHKVFKGKSASQPFSMYFQVKGSGTMQPVFMSNLQIIVNYSILQ